MVLYAVIATITVTIVTLSGIVLIRTSKAKNNLTGKWYGWFMLSITGWFYVSLLKLLHQYYPYKSIWICIYILESLGYRIAPYLYFLANVSYSSRFDNFKRQISSMSALVLIIAMYIIDIFHIDEILSAKWLGDTSVFGITTIIASCFVVISFFLCLDSFLIEKNQTSKQKRLYMLLVNLLIFPLVIVSYQFFPISEWTWYILGQCFIVYVILFMALIIRDKLFDYKVKVEISSSVRSTNSSVSFLNHTIKNELAKVKYYLNELPQKTKSETDLQDQIQLINTSTEHIMNMINRIQEKTQAVVLKEQLDSLNDIIHRALLTSSPLLTQKKIQVELQLRDEVFLICDPVHLQEVMGNLIQNAVDAITDQGKISFEIFRTNKYLILDIKDNGRGIPKANLQHVIEPFFTTKDKQTNFGLGLTYCYNIMAGHGGVLEIQSEAGKGTTIALKFPMKKIREIRPFSSQGSLPKTAPREGAGSWNTLKS